MQYIIKRIEAGTAYLTTVETDPQTIVVPLRSSTDAVIIAQDCDSAVQRYILNSVNTGVRALIGTTRTV